MSNEKTELRTVEAVVKAEGILSEKELERTLDKEGKEIIRGNITLKVDDTNFIKFNVYVGKMTKDGKENSIYSGIETVLNDYHSIAEVGEDQATKVRVTRGRVEPQTYISRRTNNPEISVRYSSNFFNRVTDEFSPHACFTIEGYVAKSFPEVNKEGGETGRLKVTILVPTYSGIEPFEFIVPEDLADAFSSIYEVGQTGKFYGDLINRIIVTENVIKMALGRDVHEEKRTSIIERVLTGASDPYEEDSPEALDQEAIRKALTEREMRIDEMKRKAADKATVGNNPAANKSSTGREIPKFASAFQGTGF